MKHRKHFGLIAFLAFLVLSGCEPFVEGSQSSGRDQGTNTSQVPIDLISAPVFPLQLEGELSDTFKPFSDYTDLQRANLREKVVGRVIQWTLPVYEISLNDGTYKVTMNSGAGSLEVLANIRARSAEDVALLSSLKTNDLISFKGRIQGIFLRSVVIIDPAIIVQSDKKTSSTPSAQVSTEPEVPVDVAPSDQAEIKGEGYAPAVVSIGSDEPVIPPEAAGLSRMEATEPRIESPSVPESRAATEIALPEKSI